MAGRRGSPATRYRLPVTGFRLFVSGDPRMQDATAVSDFIIRPITPQDNAAIAAIIRRVMPEFGADGPGFAIHDAEVDDMAAAYARPGCAYFVIERAGKVRGGGGIAPLDDPEPGICELRKMYFLPELRGLG